jgi:hypothetical protein
MTTKVTTTATQTRKSDIEIQIPYYTKNGVNFYKVKSDRHCIMVNDFNYAGKAVSENNIQYAFSEGYEVITEAEFESALQAVLNRILNN